MGSSSRLDTRRIYTGRVLNLDIDTVRFPDGTSGELELIRHSGASAVVPFITDPFGEEPAVLMIRQFRYAAEQVLFEIPAGRLDSDESPDACARRELREETGCTAGHLEHMHTMYTTPGFTDERIHLYMAWDLERGTAHHERDEFIEPVVLTLREALAKINNGEIVDGKTSLALLFAAGFRLGQ
ncbi:MAG: Methanol dehydrogenase activator [Gemmatimonadaceae bacterium]|nr:Methanol dehydrogenase activator [Gemmatimonadaceae bacterium]